MSRSLAFRKVGLTFAAQLYNQGAILGVQVLQVPFLLSTWGPERYGAWLILYAIPSYLTLTDFGFTTIAKNSMVMNAASGDHAAVVRIYQSVFALLLVSVSAFGLLCGGIIAAVDLTRVFDLGPLSEHEAKTTLLALVGGIIVYQLLLLLNGAVRASGRPATEVTWTATTRVVEAVATIAAALMTQRVEFAALAILAVRAGFALVIWLWLLKAAPDIPLGLGRARLDEVRRLANPSLSFMLLGLAQAISIQGPVVLLGAVSTTQQVVLFSTSRTLARLGTTAANVVNFPLIPEYSRLYGARDMTRFNKLLRLHVTVGVVGIALYCGGLLLVGPWLMEVWTRGHVAVVYPFFAILCAGVAAEMFWGALFAPIGATNQHVRLSYLFAVLTLLLSLPAYYLARESGAEGIAWMILILHGIMSVVMLVRR